MFQSKHEHIWKKVSAKMKSEANKKEGSYLHNILYSLTHDCIDIFSVLLSLVEYNTFLKVQGLVLVVSHGGVYHRTQRKLLTLKTTTLSNADAINPTQAAATTNKKHSPGLYLG